jgi:hypothetical protein
MHIHLLLIHTSHFILTGYENTFINVQGSNIEHIREMLAGFIIMEVIGRKGEFHYS